MNRLIFAVYHDPGSGNVATYSKTFQCGHPHNVIAELKEEVLESLAETGLSQEHLTEVFMFESVHENAPIIVGHWTAENEDF